MARRTRRQPAAAPAARPDLSAGDLLRAAHALGVQDATTLQQLAGQLGLARQRRQMVPLPAERTARPGGKAKIELPPPTVTAQGSTATTPGEARGTGSPGPAASALLQALPPLQTAPDPPAWLAPDAPALARGALRSAQRLDPLFSPQTTRALGAAVAAVQAADGEPDLDRLVAALAAREALRSLPRQPAWTLRRGLQVLVDTGPAMLPFDADVQQLLALLQRLLGSDRLQVLAFDGEPLRGCRLADDTGLGPWPRPAPGVPVLLLTDLGIGQPAGQAGRRRAAQWRPFVQAAAQAGHPLRALLPYAPARWPLGLGTHLRLLCWDRRTSVAAVRRLLAA